MLRASDLGAAQADVKLFCLDLRFILHWQNHHPLYRCPRTKKPWQDQTDAFERITQVFTSTFLQLNTSKSPRISLQFGFTTYLIRNEICYHVIRITHGIAIYQLPNLTYDRNIAIVRRHCENAFKLAKYKQDFRRLFFGPSHPNGHCIFKLFYRYLLIYEIEWKNL